MTDGSNAWRRPESVPFPTVWARFKGTTTGKEYWVQDITEEYLERVLDLLCTDFLRDEPICKYSNFLEDAESVEELREVWKECLGQRLGLMCLTKDDSGKEILVGLNATYREAKEEQETKFKGVCTKKVLGVVKYICKVKNAFAEFSIDGYLSAMGLLVLPQFRGEAIGLEILKAREPLCQAVGIKASLTVFTSIISQKLAEKAGFKDLISIPYEELERINPLFSFPGVTNFTKSMRFLYILYK